MGTQQNIAILGGGIMGLSAAYALETRGHRITLFDPAGFPASNASFIAGGMLAPYAEIEHMSAEWIAAGLHGIALWRDFAKGRAIEFHQNGSYLIAHADDQYILDRFAAHLPENAGAHKAAREIEPALQERFKAGLYLPDEAHLHPAKTMAALYAALQNKITFEHSAAEPSNIAAHYDTVIDARGIALNNPELRGVKGEIVIVRNPEFTLTRPVRLMHPRYPLYIVPREGNIFMIGATQIESDGGAHVTLRSAMELMSALYALHPSFGEAKILETLSGVRPAYPNNLPRIRQSGNIITAGGLFRHGYLLSPVMAEAIADLLENRENPYMVLFNGDRSEIDHQRTRTKLSSAA
jgi:glycine oxidase